MLYCNLKKIKNVYYIMISHKSEKIYEQQFSVEIYFYLVSKIIAKSIFTKYFF